MDAKILKTLRIGDTVRIHFTHMGATGPRSEPFDVVIAGFNNTHRAYKDGDGKYYESRQIRWFWKDLPVELQPYESVRDDVRGTDTCSEDWIIEIVKRAPHVVSPQPTNQLYATEQASFLDHQKLQDYYDAKGEPKIDSFGRPRRKTTSVGWIFMIFNETYGRNIDKGQYNGHLFELAEALIARRPQLTVRNRLDADRFYAAWNQAGRPGYVGPYQVTEFSSYMRDRNHKRIDPSPYKALVNRKAFTNWVLKNVHRFVMTKAQLMKDMIQAAIDDEEYARKSMEEDFKNDRDYVPSSKGSPIVDQHDDPEAEVYDRVVFDYNYE